MASHLIPLQTTFVGPAGGESPIIRYVLNLAEKRFPSVCLIPIATGDKPETIRNYYDAFYRYAVHFNHLSLYNQPTRDLADWIMSFDVVFVPGGNTKNLLALFRAWGLDDILKTANDNGLIIAGVSAGAICWFESGNSDYISNELNPIDGLGWLPGSLCPHYNEESARRTSYLDMVQSGRLPAGYALTHRSALHFIDGTLHAPLVEDWEPAAVYFVSPDDTNGVNETRLESMLLT